MNGISTSTLANAIVSNFGNPMDIDAVLAVLGQSLIEGAFSFGELIGFMECMNVPGLSNTLANNFSNQGLLHQLIVSNASQEYLLVLAMLNDTDFVKYVAENYSYLVAEAVRKLEGISVEQYLALVKKHYGDGVMGDLLTALGADLQFTKKFVLNEHHLYGSSRLGVKTHKRVLLQKEFSISGFEETGEIIVDEVTDSLVYVRSEVYFCRVLAQKQYEMSNHLGNVLATVLDRRTGVFDETEDTVMYYEADVVSAKAYYPFGKAMMSYSNPEFSFAYAFNGMERDDETDLTNFGARFYNGDYGKFLSVDPLVHSFPFQTPYCYAANQPIWAIDKNGEVKVIVVTRELQPDGSYANYKAEFEVLTLEDIKGISRTPVIVHRNAVNEAYQINANMTGYKTKVTSYSIDQESGLTVGEKLRKDHLYIYYLTQIMINNPLGTGKMASATQDRDFYTGEYKSDLTKITEFATGVVTMFFTGKAATKGTEELLKKMISSFLINAIDPGTMMKEIYKTLNLTEKQIQVTNAYTDKFIREGNTKSLETLQKILVDASNSENYDLKTELKNQLGIDIDMPTDSNEAVNQVVNYDGATN
ncbi:MAG: RHS repeat-associated core domain-containing protein [Bacteroidetes bacterium]|nr:RHS repeat-associated core domain-containing protein [Bacteroidota bacterium]